ncbi:hypothetical protein GW17_00036195 [Ensete ventricosum]|nr:hypothetical protein GW17_00036195 [Ensete ventricosum]
MGQVYPWCNRQSASHSHWNVGACGFCWGGDSTSCISGKVVLELAKSCEIEAAVLCHPSFINVDDIKGIPSFKNWSNSCFLNMFLLLRQSVFTIYQVSKAIMEAKERLLEAWIGLTTEICKFLDPDGKKQIRGLRDQT